MGALYNGVAKNHWFLVQMNDGVIPSMSDLATVKHFNNSGTQELHCNSVNNHNY